VKGDFFAVTAKPDGNMANFDFDVRQYPQSFPSVDTRAREVLKSIVMETILQEEGGQIKEHISAKPFELHDRSRWHTDLARATVFIYENLENRISIRDIASEVGYSTSHFAQRFKGITGQTPWQFVRELRLIRAWELLIKESHSVARVAAMTGFSDQAHLCRSFKKRFGITPKTLRKYPNKQ